MSNPCSISTWNSKQHFFKWMLSETTISHVKIWFIIQLKQRLRKPCESVRLVEEVCGVIGSSSSSTKSQSPNLEPTLQTRQTAGSELPPVGKQKKTWELYKLKNTPFFWGENAEIILECPIQNMIYVEYLVSLYMWNIYKYNICILFKSITMLIILQLKPLLTPNHVVEMWKPSPASHLLMAVLTACTKCVEEWRSKTGSRWQTTCKPPPNSWRKSAWNFPPNSRSL